MRKSIVSIWLAPIGPETWLTATNYKHFVQSCSTLLFALQMRLQQLRSTYEATSFQKAGIALIVYSGRNVRHYACYRALGA